MSDDFGSILTGLEVVIQPINLLYVLIGCVIGMVIGVLPGLGPTATIALLLPLTYEIEPASAIIMLAGIYYGAYYGGTVTSVLVQIPGEAATVVTTFDGYQMARQGRAGPALGISAIGSFIGGTIAVIGLTLFAPVLAQFAVGIGPPEYTALTVLGILLVAYLGTKSISRSLVTACVGILLATVGQDPIEGTSRFSVGAPELLSGLDFVAIAMGLFGVGEILHSLERREVGAKISSRVGRVWPSMQDWVQSRWSIVRGSVVGFVIGLFPGGGGLPSSLASYAIEKRRAKEPERFGRGAIEGVAGPETANNAGSTAAFIPLLTLGLPSNSVLALLFGALLVHNITPGPQLVDEHPDVFWGVITSMYIGNLILLVLSIPLVGLFVQLLRLRHAVIGSVAVVVSLLGVYTINNRNFEMWLVVVFGLVGYLMRKAGFEPGPLVLGFVLGDIMERAFRQSLLLSGGELSIFVQRPVSATLVGIIVLVLTWSIVQGIRKRRAARARKSTVDADSEWPES